MTYGPEVTNCSKMWDVAVRSHIFLPIKPASPSLGCPTSLNKLSEENKVVGKRKRGGK